VIVSSAVPAHNEEVAAARARGIPVLKNAEMLGRILEGKRCVAVAGTHGKTTTTGMAAWTLAQAGLDPSFVVGGELRNVGVSGRAGRGDIFVVEADEYDRRFLSYEPDVAIVLNVELDHLDYYGTEAAMRDAFAEFSRRTKRDGVLITCAEDPGCRSLRQGFAGQAATYGIETDFDPTWTARKLDLTREGSSFEALRHGTSLGEFALRLLGRHNVLNALAVIAACSSLDVPVPEIRQGLESYSGTGRRFQDLGTCRGVRVVIDYAHLPSEIRATLAAARQTTPRRVWACFQPHTYARTRALMDDFARAFSDSDRVVIVPTYVPPGRETPERDALATELADLVARRHGTSEYVESVDALVGLLVTEARDGDLVLLLGAGDIAGAGASLLSALDARGPELD